MVFLLLQTSFTTVPRWAPAGVGREVTCLFVNLANAEFSGENSDFALSFLAVWDSVLSADEMQVASDALMEYLTTGRSPLKAPTAASTSLSTTTLATNGTTTIVATNGTTTTTTSPDGTSTITSTDGTTTITTSAAGMTATTSTDSTTSTTTSANGTTVTSVPRPEESA